MKGVAARRRAWLLVAMALLACLVVVAVRGFPREHPVDLYYTWGLPIAQRHHASNLNPYADPAAYGEFLAKLAADSGSATLQFISAGWAVRTGAKIEPLGTPLLYSAGAPLPEDFDAARALFKLLQHAALVSAICLLVRLRSRNLPAALAFASFVGLSFSPFAQDVFVGNVNALQLFALAGLTYISARRLYDRHRILDYLWPAALAIFVLLKPNTLVIAAGLAIHYLLTRGRGQFVVAIASGLAGTALAFAYTGWHFGDPGVWCDWYRYVSASQAGLLTYPSTQGNVSLPLLFAERSTTMGVLGYGTVIAAMLALAFVVAATRTGKRPDLLAPTARLLAQDAGFVLSAGILATLATAPLVWQHYLLWAIVPIIWFFRFDGRWGVATWCVIASFFGFFRPMRYHLDNETYLALYPVLVLSWVPLVVAMLAYVAMQRQRLEGSAPSQAQSFGTRKSV
jgi:hypothetical protein